MPKVSPATQSVDMVSKRRKTDLQCFNAFASGGFKERSIACLSRKDTGAKLGILSSIYYILFLPASVDARASGCLRTGADVCIVVGNWRRFGLVQSVANDFN